MRFNLRISKFIIAVDFSVEDKMAALMFFDSARVVAIAFLVCMNFSNTMEQEQGDGIVAEGTNCSSALGVRDCLSESTALLCLQGQCTCYNGIKHPLFGANINIISKWNARQERCIALKGSLCDLEGKFLLCDSDMECRKADGDYGKATIGVGKCDSCTISASIGLIIFVVLCLAL